MTFDEYRQLYNLWKGELCLALRLHPEIDAEQALLYIKGLGGEISHYDKAARLASVQKLPLEWQCQFNYRRDDPIEHKQCYFWRILDQSGCERGIISAPPPDVDEDDVLEPPTLILFARYDMKIVKGRVPQNEQEPFLITGVVYDRAYMHGKDTKLASTSASSPASEMPGSGGAKTALTRAVLFARQWPISQSGSTAMHLFGLTGSIERALAEYMRQNNLKRSEIFYFGWADGPEPFEAS